MGETVKHRINQCQLVQSVTGCGWWLCVHECVCRRKAWGSVKVALGFRLASRVISREKLKAAGKGDLICQQKCSEGKKRRLYECLQEGKKG